MPRLTKQEKKEQLNEILADLSELKLSGKCENEYALEENIKFFHALYTFPKFVRWFFKERPKIDGSRLLELSDFHLHGGKWETILQQDLLEIEQWKFPDLLKHVRTTLLAKILCHRGDRPLIVASLGSGSMEVERQLIERLREKKYRYKVVFYGIDNSPQSIETAKNNLLSAQVGVVEIINPDKEKVRKAREIFKNEQFGVVLLHGNVFDIRNFFDPQAVDVIFCSKFKHHLSNSQKVLFDEIMPSAGKMVVESDDCNNWYFLYVPLKSNWQKPVLMNGAVFSCLRDPKPFELSHQQKPDWHVTTYFDGYIRSFYHDE